MILQTVVSIFLLECGETKRIDERNGESTEANMTIRHKVPPGCPVCSGSLYPTEVTCSDCGTQVRSAFQGCGFCRLTADQLQFVEIFLRSRGNLSGVGDELDISYPTVARRLEAVVAALDGRVGSTPAVPVAPAASPVPVPPEAEPKRTDDDLARERREILEMLDHGDITAEEATRRLQDL